MKVVILANGKFPEHQIPLNILRETKVIVCCDGAVEKLLTFGLEPTAIVGDLDSLSNDLRTKYTHKLFPNPDQSTNDLTKAVEWCLNHEYKSIMILGATGLREDHTLGNIGLITNYAEKGLEVKMVTDHGIFTPILRSEKLQSYKGQAISIFSQNNSTRITTKNLEFPIEKAQLTELWMGTLNRALGDWFEVITNQTLLIFRAH